MTAAPSASLRMLVDDAAPAIVGEFNRAALESLAGQLIALDTGAQLSALKRAGPGEELLYSLYEHALGPSLYLVSDGVGTRSPPHEHLTWLLIVGLSGVESSTLYRRRPGTNRRVTRIGELDVGPGEFAVLDPAAIHSTRVPGPDPIFHLHLYGRPLRSLPAFHTRTFVADET